MVFHTNAKTLAVGIIPTRHYGSLKEKALEELREITKIIKVSAMCFKSHKDEPIDPFFERLGRNFLLFS